MPILGGEPSAEHALAALLRGAGEFGYRAGAAASPAQALARFLDERLPWLTAGISGARARDIAAASYQPDSPGGRLLAQAWRFASSADLTASETSPMRTGLRMRAPLSTVFGSAGEHGALLPLGRLELDESIFPVSEEIMHQSAAELFEEFAVALAQFGPAEVSTLIQTLLTALETYAWCVPADGHSDVSIVELARAVSAIAGAAAAAEQPGSSTEYDKTE